MRQGHEDSPPVEVEITRLLGELQRAVQGPTFSYRLEEVQIIVVRLLACWARYQRRGAPSRPTPSGQ
jgi:hypothetical protein